MKVWMTAQEFADLAAAGILPDMPTTKAGMLKMIRREDWDDRRGLARPRQGRAGGGGNEYHVDNLPLSSRVALAARHIRIEPEDLRPPISEGGRLSARARQTRDARLVLLKLADRFRREQHLSIAAADGLFSDLFNASSIELPAWVTASVRRLSARSLARWRAARQDGPDRLGFDPAAARRGTGQLDRALEGRVKTFVLAAVAKMPLLSAKRLRETLDTRFSAEIASGAFSLPPLRTLQATLANWRAEYRNELMLLTDPDGYRSKVEFSVTGVIRAERLNQIWMIDASPADVMLHEGRHSIYLTVDVLARRTKIIATPTPRAAAVGLMIRKCLIAWGVPEEVLTDNGSDFVATATQRLFAALGIEAGRSQKYDPKSHGKGLVERPIGTFQRDCAGLPGFIGHSVADRKKLEGRKAFAQRLGADEKELFGVDMSLADFQAWCDDWTDTIYATDEHDGLGGRTPVEVAAGWTGKIRRIDNLAALDVLLAPVPGKDGIRTVTKTGVRIGNAHYLPDTVMPGATVFCRHDPADMGRILLFEPDGETYLGQAICPELAGLNPAETIARVKAMQKAFVDERVKPIRAAMKKIGPRDVADAMRRAGEKRAGNLIPFPRPAESHSTPALAAAADAVAPARPMMSERAAELHAEMMRAVAPDISPRGVENSNLTRLPETREQRFRRALDLEGRLAAGDELRSEELLWLGGYRDGSEYRAMRALVDEYGVEAMRL